jgi:hypothetical protein
MLSNHALARYCTDHSREACMFGRNIDMLRCFRCRYHVYYHRVLSFEHDEYQRAGFLSSWGMLKLYRPEKDLS